MSKSLYILISDGGDGSYYPRFTMNKDLIDKLQEAYDRDLMTYENGIGCDGDGFHYTRILVPDDTTYELLGISHWLEDDYADGFFESEEDEAD